MPSNGKAYGLFGLAMAVGTLAYFLFASPSDSPLDSPGGGSGSAAETPSAAAVQLASHPPSALINGGETVATERVPAEPWYAGLASRDPYPLVRALRESRQPGAFAASRQIIQLCARAYLVIERVALVSPLSDRDPQYAQRMDAKREIESRCNRFMSRAEADMNLPLPDDKAGQRYVQTFEALSTFPPDGEAVMAAARELQSQGQLHEAARAIAMSQVWRGEPWRHSQDEFVYATRKAALLATSMPGAVKTDLRGLTACYEDGRCGEDIHPVPSDWSAEQRQRVEALVADMTAAFRNHNLEAWTHRKK